jgi:large subunit ribosomal protein L25
MAREMKATLRSEVGKHAAKRLRNQNLIPAVVYREGKPGTNLSLDMAEWTKVLASGEHVVTLKIEGGDRSALIKDVQYDHLGTATLHVDFNELKAGQKVRLAVSVVLKGIPKGAAMGGHLNHEMHTIHVECLPEKSRKITIDVAPMELDDLVHIRDVKPPTACTPSTIRTSSSARSTSRATKKSPPPQPKARRRNLKSSPPRRKKPPRRVRQPRQPAEQPSRKRRRKKRRSRSRKSKVILPRFDFRPSTFDLGLLNEADRRTWQPGKGVREDAA